MTLSLILSAVNTYVANGCSIAMEVGIQKAEGGELHSSAQRIMVEGLLKTTFLDPLESSCNCVKSQG